MGKRKEVITKSEMVAIQNSVTNEMEFAKVSIRVEKDIPKYKNEPFTILFQVANSLLIGDMPFIDCKVVLYLMASSQYGNVIDRTIKEMADEMKIKDSNYVQKSLKRLEEQKIVLRSKHPHDSRRYVYMLNPKQSWKGSVKDRLKSISSFDQSQLMLFPVDGNEPVEMPIETKSKKNNKKIGLPLNYNFLDEKSEQMGE